MSRKIQCITMALFLSALMTASVQAAPTRAPQRPTPAVSLFTDAWKLLSAWLRGHTHYPPSSAPDISCQIDPNGQH